MFAWCRGYSGSKCCADGAAQTNGLRGRMGYTMMDGVCGRFEKSEGNGISLAGSDQSCAVVRARGARLAWSSPAAIGPRAHCRVVVHYHLHIAHFAEMRINYEHEQWQIKALLNEFSSHHPTARATSESMSSWRRRHLHRLSHFLSIKQSQRHSTVHVVT